MKSDIKKLVADIQGTHGKQSIMRLGDQPDRAYNVLPTGIAQLDAALGVGGIVRGQPVEIYGPESSGKTTLALHVVAAAQKLGGVCAYIDVEHALDPVYAAAIGVDVKELLFTQPDSAEQGLGVALDLARSGQIAVIVVDSIAALVPAAEIAGDIGDSHVGLQPRLMGQTMRLMKPALEKTETIALFINQLRFKIGERFGNPETTPGGQAMRYAAGVRLDIRRAEAVKMDTDSIHTRVKVMKNKWAPPFRVAEFDIVFGKGVSVALSLLDVALDVGVIQKNGAWYSYGGANIGQGRDVAGTALEEHPALMEEIALKVREVA